ncbi:MAG: hypothetical protein ACXVFQ_20105 [Solirubrobacteraceae bacterium]
MSAARRTSIAIVAAMLLLGLAPAASGNTLVGACNGDPNGCDETGSWYTSPVTVRWEASPVPSISDGCQTKTYLDTKTTVSCQVWWGVATAVESFPLNVEVSSPTVVTSVGRPPDSGGWFNHPLTVSVSGRAFSGIASCSAATYAGPDSATAQVTGTCVDNAGKTATATVTFRYDSTPPALLTSADPGDGSVKLRALATDLAPVVRIQIVRSPGLGHAKTSTLHSGSGSFDDTRVRNGSRYRYTFIVRDVAGNVSERTVTVVPGPRLLAPVRGAAVMAPPLLRWTPVRHADYYNVQLIRGRKILSRWPAHASLQLKAAWKFAGRHFRLRPGRYRWYVWPGFGPPSAARYGHLIGSGAFVVRG